MSYDEAQAWLEALDVSAQKLGLERIERFLLSMNNPHWRLQVIHIGGTNGKGSCSAMLTSVLKASGLSVGTFTSPHLVTPRERVSVNGQWISENDWAYWLSVVRHQLEALAWPQEEWLTYFECVTALAFLYFEANKLDWVVLEVGLGGRLDSTNCIPRPAVSVITSIGLDHTEHLGHTLAEIAREKAGIIKAGCPVVVGPNLPEEALSAILQNTLFQNQAQPVLARANRVQSTVCQTQMKTDAVFEVPLQEVVDTLTGTSYTLSMAGKYQLENLSTVLSILSLLTESGKLTLQPEAISVGLGTAVWPARLQWVSACRWVVDGSHNAEGFLALAETLSEWKASANLGDTPIYWLVSQRNNRSPEGLLSVIRQCPNTAGVFFTQSAQKVWSQKTGKSLYHAPEALEAAWLDSADIAPPVNLELACGAFHEGVAWLRQKTQGQPAAMGFVTGSLYTAGDVLAWLEENGLTGDGFHQVSDASPHDEQG